ncbi:hypothetical protein BC830DRAFT_1076654 [Chytriomyces sp. MP71]|nr:hypothetical protein BC830DRAFT_1076654 [Chytriomyces sp. MP71]
MRKPIAFTAEEAARAFARAKLSRNGNMVPIAKVYYYESYRKTLASASFVGVVQNNNLSAAEYRALKLKLTQAGFTVSTVRNAMFGAAVHDHFASLNVANSDSSSTQTPQQASADSTHPQLGYVKLAIQDTAAKRIVSRFKRMLVGPSIIVSSSASHTESPFLMADAIRALAPESLTPAVAKKVLVAGALVDGKHVLSRQQLEDAAKLPSLQRLREELVGVLSSPASRLVGLLSTQPQNLVRTLSGRV